MKSAFGLVTMGKRVLFCGFVRQVGGVGDRGEGFITT